MEETIRILVVDDEPDIRRICRILLENSGYTVLEAATGLEAVETIRRCPEIDLILMDIMMPDLDGLRRVQPAARLLDGAGAVPHGQDAGKRQAPRLRRRRRRLSGQAFSHAELMMKVESRAALPGV